MLLALSLFGTMAISIMRRAPGRLNNWHRFRYNLLWVGTIHEYPHSRPCCRWHGRRRVSPSNQWFLFSCHSPSNWVYNSSVMTGKYHSITIMNIAKADLCLCSFQHCGDGLDPTVSLILVFWLVFLTNCVASNGDFIKEWPICKS
jgi:hypothetical protein